MEIAPATSFLQYLSGQRKPLEKLQELHGCSRPVPGRWDPLALRGRAQLWLHHEATGRAAKCPSEGPCEGGVEETWSPPFEAPPKKVTWCSVPAPRVATAKGEENGTNYPYKDV